MKEYLKPEIEDEVVEIEDVIAASSLKVGSSGSIKDDMDGDDF